jgi:hypothetical protein
MLARPPHLLVRYHSPFGEGKVPFKLMAAADTGRLPVAMLSDSTSSPLSLIFLDFVYGRHPFHLSLLYLVWAHMGPGSLRVHLTPYAGPVPWGGPLSR